MQNTRLWLLTPKRIAILLALTLVVAGCGGDDKEPEATTATTAAQEATTTAAPEAPATTAAEEDEPEEAPTTTEAMEEPVEKPVIVASLADTPNLIELHTFRTTSAYAVTNAVYEPLIKQVLEEQPNGLLQGSFVDHHGAGAESFEITETADGGFLATFTIRQGQTFSDGTPVTAADYKYVFDRSIEGPGYIGLLLPFVGISSTDQIRVTGDYTFEVETTVQSPLFRRFLTFQVFGAMNKAEAEANATEDDPWSFAYYNDKGGGSGPYWVSKFDPDNEVVLEPNPGYWNADALPNAGVIIRPIPDANEKARLIAAGEIDVATGIPPKLLAVLEDDPNVTIWASQTTGVHYLAMNQTIAPMDNLHLRQAIVSAVPYQALIDNVMFGFASPAKGVVTSNMETHDSSIGANFSQDLDAARAHLEAAGVGDLTLVLGVRESRLGDQEAAVLIQDSLRQIGLTVDVQILPDGDFSGRINANELPLFIHDWFSWGEDPFYQMRFLTTCGQFVNYARFCNEAYDALVAEGTFTTDPAVRQDVSSQAQQIFLDQAVWAPLWSSDRTYVTHRCVTGVVQDYTRIPVFTEMSKIPGC
ncbi:MAG: ABC transporter substrate-binding protein [bacterium]|nr:ABC transporter substrate-binding protein [bacterium]